MASRFLTAMYVLGLLVCGSLNTITMKIAFTLKGINTDGEERVFQKPWFITFVMFIAMSMSLLCDGNVFKKSSSLQESLIDACPGSSPKAMPWARKVRIVAIPAVFDMLATSICSMGFLYIPASVWQLLRGAEMVFAALFSVVLLRRRLQAFHWLGVSLCVLGIILVGLASIWGGSTTAEGGESSGDTGGGGDAGRDGSSSQGTEMLLLGMALALGGQVVQAAQVIAEEWLLKDVDLPGLQIVGFEGMWGSLITLVVAFPVLFWLPGDDRGHLENELDAFSMVYSSFPLLVMILVYTVSCATYNMAGIAVTGALSAVHRVMLEAFRTLIVWVFGLVVHYGFDPQSKFGEAWTPYSWLEVMGFIVLLLGQAVFGEMLRVPGLRYPVEDAAVQALPSPGSLRVLTSPLPETTD